MASLLVGCTSAVAGQETPEPEAPVTPGDGPDAGAVCSGDPCDLVDQCGCDVGQACGLDTANLASAATTCRAIQFAGIDGDACDTDAECGAGLGCFGTCRTFCERDSDCGAANSFCLVPVMDSGQQVGDVRVCTPRCKPEAQTQNGCPSGQACDLYRTGDSIYTNCRAAGTGGEGDDCDGSDDCRAGFSCVTFSSTYRICTQLCLAPPDPYDAPDELCEGSNLCRGFGGDGWWLGSTEYGACAP